MSSAKWCYLYVGLSVLIHRFPNHEYQAYADEDDSRAFGSIKEMIKIFFDSMSD